MARHDAISKECDQLIREMLLRGDATRAIARHVGCAPKTVEFRRTALKREGAVFAKCKCGRPVTHRGTCKWKVKRFRSDPNPKRGFMPRTRSLKGWEETIRNAKAVPIPRSNSPKKVLQYLHDIVPRSLYTSVREDVVGDLCEMFYGGEIHLGDAPDKLPVLISKNHELSFGPVAAFSLDEARGERGGMTAHEVVMPSELTYVSSLGGWEDGVWPGFYVDEGGDEW